LAAPIGRRLVKRKIRRVLEIALPVSGMGVIFGSVLTGPSSLQLQVLFLLFGILILEAGVWGLAARLLPNERRYLGLREEGNHFIELIRQLNRAAVARQEVDGGDENEEHFRDALKQMHASVRRMGELAGKDTRGGKVEPSATDLPAGEVAASDRDTSSEPAEVSAIDSSTDSAEASATDTPSEEAGSRLDTAKPLP
jgi:hypothetical protein